MPSFFGLSAMPTTLLNAALSTLPDRSLPVRGPNRLAVVSPMYNEEAGARRALASLLSQRCLPDELAVSINGSTDRTHEVVSATLEHFGFERRSTGPAPGLNATLERWQHDAHAMAVLVLTYAQRTAKSEAINNLVASRILRAERVLLVDGDTVFDREFIAALEQDFYRLRWIDGRPVLEDYALQSGSVTSFVPAGARPAQRFIAAGRSAEYAFASVLRRGQVRTHGDSGLWGASRLFTVVGCGFAVRKDVLPMPPDTLTEDHDLTLAVQALPRRVERVSPGELSTRGFRIVVEGDEVPFDRAFDREDVIEVRHGGNARFVGDARMYTEDPAHAGGYLRQIERWHGGGIQNAMKRFLGDPGERAMSANVRFTLVGAQLENLLGLLLLLLVPVMLALGVTGAMGSNALVRNLALWLGIDLVATGLMTFAGFFAQARGAHRRRAAALGFAARRSLLTWLPYMVLKVANPVSFVAAASSVVPAYFRERRAVRRRAVRRTQGVAWERPTSRGVDARTVGTAATMLTSLTAVFIAILALVPTSGADQVATQRLLARTPRLDMAQYEWLPLRAARVAPVLMPGRAGNATVPVLQASMALALDPVQRAVRVLQAPGARATLTGAVALRPPAAFVRLGAASGAGPAADGTTAATPPPSVTPIPALSNYCRSAYLRHPSVVADTLPGTAAAYRPLNHFELLMLGRLAPIEPYVEQAATAYGVSARLLLQVLINESYLNPLAVGETGDKGLSQMTSDALTLLRAVSGDVNGPQYNPHLVSGSFNVFDPDFSICAGAAKLAWAVDKPVAKDDALAYALYINPVHGVTRSGQIVANLKGPVEAMAHLGPLVDTLGSAYAAYRADPASVALPERQLVAVSADVAAGNIGLPAAYQRSQRIVASNGVEDAAMYATVLQRLFSGSRASVASNARASAR